MSLSGRCYLSGIDWTFYTLHYLSCKATGCGNNSQVILSLDRPLDIELVRTRLTAFARLFPVINATCVRAWNLAPFWSFPDRFPTDIPVTAITLATDDDAMHFLHDHVNQPFARERDHLRFAHITVGTRALTSLVFDHRLLDARGAQNFLYLFHQFYSEKFSLAEPFKPQRPSNLSLWKEKFLAGQRVNRRFVDLASDGESRHFSLPADLKDRKFIFRTITFDRAQSEKITEQAYDTAGYLMMAPFFLAVTLAAFADVFKSRLSPGNSFVIPVNTDIRSRNPGLPELFFNHLSFFFLKFLAADIKLTRDFIKHVSRTMYEVMSGGFAQDLAQATLLLRALPQALLDPVQRRLMHVKGLSFSFSYVNKGYEGGEFCGAGVNGVIHTPRVAITPGIGIFFTQYNGSISLTFATLEGLVSDQEAIAFIEKMRMTLVDINQQ
ncbi:MAG: hypothetical protein HQL22_02745 [Candidatus Omnitrophica bacterium]|nr:hypothetical protein [Candidatus Omnitrophota bacterium]